jgi:hypothetical protein
MSRVLCFCWNSDRTPLCESYLENKSKSEISRPGGFFSKSGSCYNPLFFDQIQVQIEQFNPILAVFLTENDPVTGSHFHSNFLPDKMKSLSYKLLERDKYVDSDETNSLRMSIFVKLGAISVTGVELSKGLIFNDNKFECNRTYLGAPKALVLYVSTLFGKFAFIGVQVPRGYNDRTICTTALENKFIKDKNLDTIFIMGDFANEYIIKKEDITYAVVDKLRKQSIIPGYREDLVDTPVTQESTGEPPNTPPQLANSKFLVPTYSPAYENKFVDGDNGGINTYNDLLHYPYDKIELGYHDRIFHKTIQGYPVIPIDYMAIAGSPMLHADSNNPERTSNHLGVLGIYSFQGASY